MIKKKDILIIGAGGFGREILALLQILNSENEKYNILGFVDDGVEPGTLIKGYKVIGNVAHLVSLPEKPSLVFAIGNTAIKKRLAATLSDFIFETLIHPSISIRPFQNITLGKGVVICEGTILTCDIVIEDFTLLNLQCTVGHDTVVKKYTSVMPGCNISGEVVVGEGSFVGTGTKIINQVTIGDFSVIGAGTIVIKDVPDGATVVGNPGKIIKIAKP